MTSLSIAAEMHVELTLTGSLFGSVSNDRGMAALSLRPLSGSWRTFPGARRPNGRGLKSVSANAGTEASH